MALGLASGLVAPGVSPAAAAPGAPAAEPAAAGARTCDGKRATIVGTQGKDVLVGTPRADVIVGLGGRDRIEGLGGGDRLCGGAGTDRLYGGDGDDRVFGQRDGCSLDEGCSYVGDDLAGGPGDDLLDGGDDRAPDRVLFPRATQGVTVDLVAGTSTGFGTDRLRGVGKAILTRFDDSLRGLDDFGYADTGGGDDVVRVGARGWYGLVTTGTGDDRVVSAGRGDVYLGDGDDVVRTAAGARVLDGEGNDRIVLTGERGSSVETGPGNDVVEGSEGNDDIEIGPGDDVVHGNGGNDYIRDGTDASTIDGGEGDDWIQGGRGTDRYDGGPGVDLIDYLQVDGDVGVEVDLVTGTATGSGGDDELAGFEDVFGTSRSDVIRGDDGPNHLDGGYGGTDSIRGAGGADVLAAPAGELWGEGGDDQVELEVRREDAGGYALDGGDGRDVLRLREYIFGADGLVVDLTAGTVTLGGTSTLAGIEDVVSSESAQTIIGDDGPNLLSGLRGNDVLRGAGGDDALIGGGGRDRADGGADVDTCVAEVVTACEG